MSLTFDDDLDPRTFSGVTRLFPLPGVVLFPQNVLPLHIFEPRYRQMTEDAIADDKLITIAGLKIPRELLENGEPMLEPVGCIGKIVRHERLSDGRYNFLLVGRQRIHLTNEIETKKLYRTFHGSLLTDESPELHTDHHKRDLSHLFKLLLQREDAFVPELASLLESDRLNLGQLTDIISHAMGFPHQFKQSLLENLNPISRADALLKELKIILGPDAVQAATERPFPPDFSPN